MINCLAARPGPVGRAPVNAWMREGPKRGHKEPRMSGRKTIDQHMLSIRMNMPLGVTQEGAQNLILNEMGEEWADRADSLIEYRIGRSRPGGAAIPAVEASPVPDGNAGRDGK